MELTFVKNEKAGSYVAEFEVTADFNLHIEREKGGRIFFYQRTSAEGGYAHIDNVGWQDGKPVIDLDFAGLIYPKYIKVVSEIQPTVGIVTIGSTSNGGNNGGGGEGNNGSSIIHIMKEQREVEEYIEADDYYINYDLFIDVDFDLDKKEVVRDDSYKLTMEGGENGEVYYKEFIHSCRYDEPSDTLYFSKGDTNGYILSMIPNRDIDIERFDYVSASTETITCSKGEHISLNVDIADVVVDGMKIRRDW